MQKLNKKDRIKVSNNSILTMMGFPIVTGEVFLIYPEGDRISLKCDQTKAMELVYLNDGEITKI